MKFQIILTLIKQFKSRMVFFSGLSVSLDIKLQTSYSLKEKFNLTLFLKQSSHKSKGQCFLNIDTYFLIT